METGQLRHGHRYLAALVGLLLAPAVMNAKVFESRYEGDFTDGQVPLVAQFSKGQDFIDQKEYALFIEGITIDGISVYPREVSMLLEIEAGWEDARANSWEVYTFYTDNAPNRFSVDVSFDSSEFYEWKVSRGWHSLVIEYGLRNREGKHVAKYRSIFAQRVEAE